MNIGYYIESGLLEQYALDELDLQQTAHIQKILANSLELGEALEHIYVKLEQQQNDNCDGR